MLEQKEIQLIYNALMHYGNSLSGEAREYFDHDISDLMADKAKEAWQLARKIADGKED